MFIIGGYDRILGFNERSYVYNIDTKEWKNLTTSGPSPKGLCFSDMLFSSKQIMTVFFVFTNWAERNTVSFGTALICTLIFSLWNQSASGIPLQSSQCFAWFSIVYWNACFWVCFCSSYIIFRTFGNSVFVLFKLAMKCYLMRMCSSWLCSFNCECL